MTVAPPPAVRVDQDIRRKYDALIESLRVSESRDPAANRFPWQCEVALKQLADFAVARQKEFAVSGKTSIVRLRTDSFPSRIYAGEVNSRLHSLLENGGELRILLTKGEGQYDLPSLGRFVKAPLASVRQETSPPIDEFRNHFFVVGERAYRFEAPHEPFVGTEFRLDDDFHPEIPARICFNDEHGAKSLTRLFDALWDSAVPLAALSEGGPSERRSGQTPERYSAQSPKS